MLYSVHALHRRVAPPYEWLKRARERAAIEQQILSGDVARMGGAQECTGCAELLGGAEPLRRNGRDPLLDGLLNRDAALGRGHFHVRLQPIRRARARPKKIDRVMVPADPA